MSDGLAPDPGEVEAEIAALDGEVAEERQQLEAPAGEPSDVPGGEGGAPVVVINDDGLRHLIRGGLSGGMAWLTPGWERPKALMDEVVEDCLPFARESVPNVVADQGALASALAGVSKLAAHNMQKGLPMRGPKPKPKDSGDSADASGPSGADDSGSIPEPGQDEEQVRLA